MYLRAGVDVCSVFDQILLFRLRRLYVMASRGESHACIALDRAPSDADYEAVRCRTPLVTSRDTERQLDEVRKVAEAHKKELLKVTRDKKRARYAFFMRAHVESGRGARPQDQ